MCHLCLLSICRCFFWGGGFVLFFQKQVCALKTINMQMCNYLFGLKKNNNNKKKRTLLYPEEFSECEILFLLRVKSQHYDGIFRCRKSVQTRGIFVVTLAQERDFLFPESKIFLIKSFVKRRRAVSYTSII